MFDPNVFLNQTVDAPMSTRITPCPEGEFKARVDDSDADISKWFRTIKWTDKVTNEAKMAPGVKIPMLILDEGVHQRLNKPAGSKVIVLFDFFLDLDEQGKLDTGPDRNVKLGQLREATGLNGPGFTFQRLRGAGPFLAKVSQRSDPKDPEVKYAEVVRVTKLT